MTKDELLNGAVSAQTGAELWALLLSYCKEQGIARVSYHHHGHDEVWGRGSEHSADPQALDRVRESVIRSPTPNFHIVAHGFPREWVDRYVDDRLYTIDPIPELARRTAEPFLWSDTARMTELLDKQAAYLDALDTTVTGDGVAIQVFGPNMRHGYFGFGFSAPKAQITPAKMAEFQIVAQLLHLRACTLIEASNSAEVALSPREREVLGWMAQGKSKSVIAQILDVSVHTVDTLVRRIFRKLEVVDRTTAVLKAVNLGLIQSMAGDVT